MSSPGTPYKGSVFRAVLPSGEAEVLVLSADEANAIRRVVLFCELFPVSAGLSLDSPTNVLLVPEDSGLEAARVAQVGNVYTLPKTALVELLGFVRGRLARRSLDAAIELAFGLRPWV